MKIKVIKTEKDYKAALKAIESLWNAKPNTPPRRQTGFVDHISRIL
jgi:hypothetical protein